MIAALLNAEDPCYFMVLFVSALIAELDNRMTESFPSQPDMLRQTVQAEVRGVNFQLLFFNVDQLKKFIEEQRNA